MAEMSPQPSNYFLLVLTPHPPTSNFSLLRPLIVHFGRVPKNSKFVRCGIRLFRAIIEARSKRHMKFRANIGRLQMTTLNQQITNREEIRKEDGKNTIMGFINTLRRKSLVLAAGVTLLSLAAVACGAVETDFADSEGHAERFESSLPAESAHDAPSLPSFQSDHISTGVYINGEEAPFDVVAQIQMLIQGTVPAGSYWLDANGDYGVEGGPMLGNLYGGQFSGSAGGGMQRTMFGDVGGGNFYDPSTGCSVMQGGGVSC